MSRLLLFFPVSLGIFLAYHILRVTDLTVDGSFVLGAGLYARWISEGGDPILGAVIAISAGVLVGVIVSEIQRENRIHPLLAGIIMVFILMSANLKLMGRPNIGIFELTGLFESPLQFSLFCTLGLLALLYIILHTNIGLHLRAFGQNRSLLAEMGKKPEIIRKIGLGASNGIVAFAGVLGAQASGYADIQMGFGLALVGIGTVVLGLELFKRLFPANPLGLQVVSPLFGSLIYFILLNIFLRFGLDTIYLKMILGGSLAFFLYSVQRARAIP